MVDKAPDMTSHDVVAIARRSLGTKKIGHCGT
ncbi:MAG: tRNA pseudouridine(55) synthase TruB, partial [Verrucomicrobiota bacterium]